MSWKGEEGYKGLMRITDMSALLTIECPRCSETLSDRYSNFPSPVNSMRKPGITWTNSFSSWNERNPVVASALLAVSERSNFKSE